MASIQNINKPGNNPHISAKKVKPKKKKYSPEKIAGLKTELTVQLQHLRTVLKEIIAGYTSNLERDIISILSELTNTNGHKTDHKQLKASHVKQMLEIMEDLSLKPEKGRRKDLKKIEDAVKNMLKLHLKG